MADGDPTTSLRVLPTSSRNLLLQSSVSLPSNRDTNIATSELLNRLQKRTSLSRSFSLASSKLLPNVCANLVTTEIVIVPTTTTTTARNTASCPWNVTNTNRDKI